MDALLHFVITKVDGTQMTQDITCPSDASEKIMQQMFAQFAQVGVMKKQGSTFTLLPSAQIAFVEIELPTLVIANESETKQVAKAAEGIRRIK